MSHTTFFAFVCLLESHICTGCLFFFDQTANTKCWFWQGILPKWWYRKRMCHFPRKVAKYVSDGEFPSRRHPKLLIPKRLRMSALINTVACMIGDGSYMSLRFLSLAPWPPNRPKARFVLRFASRKSFDRHSCTLGVISGTRSLSSPWLTLLRYSYNPLQVAFP